MAARIILIYYLICYSAGLVGFLSALASAATGDTGPGVLRDRRFAGLSGAFALIVIPYSFMAYLDGLPVPDPTAYRVLMPLSVVGDAALVLALPHFIDGFSLRPRGPLRQGPWPFLSALAAASGLSFLFDFRLWPAMYATFGFMIAAIALVILKGPSIRASLAAADPAKDPSAASWISLNARFTLLTAIAFLPMLAVDFFPSLIAWKIKGFPPSLRIFPALYAALNLLYAARAISRLVSMARSSPTAKGTPPVMEWAPNPAADLTRREIEVARLLAEGATYKELCWKLRIRMGTAQSHVTKLYRKLGINCKEDLMRIVRGECLHAPRQDANQGSGS